MSTGSWIQLIFDSIWIGLLSRSGPEQIECPGKRRAHASYFYGLDCHRRVFAGQSADRSLLPASRQRKHGGVFHLRARCFVVAGGNVNGGHDVCGRHSAAGLRIGRAAGNCRELDLVGVLRRRHDDGVLLCALLAAGGNSDGRAVGRASLWRQASSLSARLQGNLSRAVYELLHPGMGDAGHGQHHHGFAGSGDCSGARAASDHWRSRLSVHAGRSPLYIAC